MLFFSLLTRLLFLLLPLSIHPPSSLLSSPDRATFGQPRIQVTSPDQSSAPALRISAQARNSSAPLLLALMQLLPGDLLARARPHHRLAPACQATPKLSSNEARTCTRRDPGVAQARRRPPISRPAPISWIGPSTSLGPPRTSPNQSRTTSYASG